MNILFVCTGNTCRSPMAEGFLRSEGLNNINVESRGLCADSTPVSENSRVVMSEIGIDISHHISKQLTISDINLADKIICLSPSHLFGLKKAGVSEDKLFLLGDGIPDPYDGDTETYRVCRDEIISAIKNLINSGFFDDFKVVPIEQKHIKEIARLEKICFSEPWSENGILESFKTGTLFFVAVSGNSVLGYIGIKPVIDEGYITNIAVFPESRKKGVGAALLKRTFELAEQRELAFISLEVRASNIEAISLYEKFQFITEGRRKNFYINPIEDAYIMTKRFGVKNENSCN